MATNEAVPAHADVVIVGAGIVGCAAAYYLAKRGVHAVVIEKDVVGRAQSGRNWGFVRQQGRDPVELPLMIESNRIWSGIERELGADVEWVQGGNLGLATARDRLELFERWAATAPLSSSDELRRRLPSHRGRILRSDCPDVGAKGRFE